MKIIVFKLQLDMVLLRVTRGAFSMQRSIQISLLVALLVRVPRIVTTRSIFNEHLAMSSGN